MKAPPDVQPNLVSWLSPIRSALDSVKTRGWPTMIANFAVTYRCTSRCKTCSIWKMDQPEQGELSLEEIRVLFSSNRGFLRDVGSIQITGGEPFLRADLPELVSSIREQLSECTFWIPTNGMTPNSIEKATRTTLESLDGHGLGVSVSIDGLGRTHDGVRGIPGSFERAVETLTRLSAVRGDHPGLGLSVGMTLTPDNFRELGDVFNLARSHGAEFSFRPVNYSGIYYRNLGDELSMAGFEGELLPAIRGIGRDAVERHGPWKAAPTLRYMQGVMDHVRNPRGRRLRCSAGSGSLFLDPYGNVYPCVFLDERMGNVREQGLGEIWSSKEAYEARIKVRNGECPGCWVECETFRDINRDLKGLASTVLWALLHPETAGIS